MTILIKGMEMPKKGYKDIIYGTLWSDGRFTLMKSNNAISEYEVVEVPTPHGRLIDATELLRDSEGIILETIDDHEEVEEMIKDAPTVIEAEEGE